MADDHERRAPAKTIAQEKLGFMRKFDGTQAEIPAQEQRKAAGVLSGAIEQALTTHAGHTEGSLFTYLNLSLSFEDDSGITFVITTSSFMKGAGGASGKVRVMERDPFGNYRETYDYEIATDGGSVRRIDVGDEWVRRTTGEPGVVRVIGADVQQDAPYRDAAENFRLQEAMGLNNQPVDSQETGQVSELMLQAGPAAA